MAYLPTKFTRPWLGAAPSLRAEMNRLFDDFALPGEALGREGWTPPLDVSETREKVRVVADLPGVAVKDVHVELVGNVLSIRGEKKSENETRGDNWLQVERSSGSFVRSVLLPDGLDPEKIEAKSHDGVLTVEIAKTEAARPREIPVKHA